VRVLAVRFPDKERASTALDLLRERLRLSDGDAAIAPMGTPGEVTGPGQTLLAGHFPEDQTGLVRTLVRQSGGEVVADVDEQWTRPPRPPPSQSDVPQERSAPQAGASVTRRASRPQREPMPGRR